VERAALTMDAVEAGGFAGAEQWFQNVFMRARPRKMRDFTVPRCSRTSATSSCCNFAVAWVTGGRDNTRGFPGALAARGLNFMSAIVQWSGAQVLDIDGGAAFLRFRVDGTFFCKVALKPSACDSGPREIAMRYSQVFSELPWRST